MCDLNNINHIKYIAIIFHNDSYALCDVVLLTLRIKVNTRYPGARVRINARYGEGPQINPNSENPMAPSAYTLPRI